MPILPVNLFIIDLKKSISFQSFMSRYVGYMFWQKCTANIFKVIFTVFNVSDFPTAVSLYGLHLIAAPSTIK